MKRFYLFFSFFICNFFLSQLDNTHYLQPIIFGAYTNGTITEEFIYLSTPSTSDITVSIRLPDETTIPRLSVFSYGTGNTATVTNGTVVFNNSNPVRISIINNSNAILPPGSTPLTMATNLAGTIIPANAGGLIFKSSSNFFVNYRGRSASQAGSVLTKGKAALGKTFYWGGTPTESPTTISEIGNMLSILATEDNTLVTISNIDAGTEFINGSSATPITGGTITRTLNKGQSFVLYAKSQNNQLSIQDTGWLGAKISSDKNVAVTVGGLMQQGGTGANRDFGVDQLVPLEQLGNEYIVMQGNGDSLEKVIVIASQQNTSVRVNGSSSVNYTLVNEGDYIIIPATSFVNKTMYLKTDKAVSVFHKVYGNSVSNTNSFMFIPPISCFGQTEVDMIPDAKQIGNTQYANTELVIVAASGSSNIPVVTVGGNTLSPYFSASIPGNTNWYSYRYNIADAPPTTSAVKNVKITSAGAIQAEIIGANNNAGFGGYYTGFGNSPIINIGVNTPFLRPCTSDTGNSMLTVPSGQGTYQWYKNGVPIPGATSNTYAIPASDTTPAEYNAIINVPGGCTLYSNYTKTYKCPCYKPGATGTGEQTNIGISTRVARSTANWPKDVNNGFIALESNDKGMVITRIPNPETAILNPVDGMIVFDTDDFCLKIYNGTVWNCINQTCNNEN